MSAPQIWTHQEAKQPSPPAAPSLRISNVAPSTPDAAAAPATERMQALRLKVVQGLSLGLPMAQSRL